MTAKTILRTFCFALGVASFSATTSHAELLAYEGFDYNPGGARLNSLHTPPDGGFGWAGRWVNVDNGNFITHRVSGTQSSLDPGFDFQTAGRHLITELGTNDPKYRNAYRQLSTPIDFGGTGTYYVSVLMGASSHQSSDTFLYLGGSRSTDFGGSGGAVRIGLGAASSFGGAVGRFTLWVPGQQTILSQSANTWNENQAYLAVLKIATSATGPDTVSVSYFGAGNPMPTSEPESWLLSTTTESSIQADWIRLFAQGNADNSIHSTFDEIRIGTTWDSVTPIPEPSHAALAVGALAMLFVYRLRRRA